MFVAFCGAAFVGVGGGGLSLLKGKDIFAAMLKTDLAPPAQSETNYYSQNFHFPLDVFTFLLELQEGQTIDLVSYGLCLVEVLVVPCLLPDQNDLIFSFLHATVVVGDILVSQSS